MDLLCMRLFGSAQSYWRKLLPILRREDGRGGSMRIIKQRRPKATKNILRFRCCRCGCEFEADDTEYEQASQIAYVHDGIIATCICPCCGARVYMP